MNIMYVKDCTGITDCTENDENCTENDVKVVQSVRAKEKYPWVMGSISIEGRLIVAFFATGLG